MTPTPPAGSPATDTPAETHPRPEPPLVAGELATLTGFVAFLRATLARKCAGLGDADLHRPLAPSPMTLGGMLAHLAFVEDYWFAYLLAGDMPEPWASADWDADPDLDWHLAPAMGRDALRAMWAAACARSDEVLAAHVARAALEDEALAATFARKGNGEEFSVRWLLTHMVEEYARHCGHADLLREAIDGEVGE